MNEYIQMVGEITMIIATIIDHDSSTVHRQCLMAA